MQTVSKAFTDLKPSLIALDVEPADSAIANLRTVINQTLTPKVQDIDFKGEFPEQIMHDIGTAGAFSHAVSTQYEGSGKGLKYAVQSIEEVSKDCLSTGFITWCQVACTWYLENTENAALREKLLPEVASGRVLAGTGLSNPMKHFADIEKIALSATRVDGGYVVNGMLPWVSNLGAGHYFGIAAKMTDSTGADTDDYTSDSYMMAMVSDELEGMSLRCNAHFIALEGTGTYSCLFRDSFIPDELVLAAPCAEYVDSIRPGFMLTQVGMGLGLTASCIELMRRSNKRLGHVNRYLDDQVEDIDADLQAARQRTYEIANRLNECTGIADASLNKEIVQARATASELALRSSQGAMLHAGARAYVKGSAAERKLREAYFVAIVTPALKHLKKVLAGMS
ncbi:MAG: acyl-CoA dehydrogenase family protein [Cyanobacteria bacterium J06560_2]